MIISIKAFPKSKRREIIEKNGVIKAYLNSAPEKGKANHELIAILAEYYKIPKGRIKILKGETGRNKLVEIAK